jgi:hypothetical protein
MHSRTSSRSAGSTKCSSSFSSSRSSRRASAIALVVSRGTALGHNQPDSRVVLPIQIRPFPMRAVHAMLLLATVGGSGSASGDGLTPVFESWGRILRWNRAEGAVLFEVRRPCRFAVEPATISYSGCPTQAWGADVLRIRPISWAVRCTR